MKIRYKWISEYSDPNYWSRRTPLLLGAPKIFNLYMDLNDNKLRNFLKKCNGRILDAGCGTGRFLHYADVGIDFSKGMLNQAKRARKSLVVASIPNLPIRDKTFAVAFTVDVLLHVKPARRKDTIRELKRVADTVYNFLSEQRTILPFVMQSLENLHFKPRRLIPYVALFLAFPFDRFKKLKVNNSLLVEGNYESASC